ncbi:MAG: DUF2461 domain-containing protein [Hyphomicrobiales bacterium]
MKEILNFLSDLRDNNNKEWFDLNRDRYQQTKELFLELTEQFNSAISLIDKDIPIVNPKDCMFRIFRDVRFSKDKTPYKINYGSYISIGGRKSNFPGYYIHIEPNNSFFGGGYYYPSPEHLKLIRDEIYNNASELNEIINNKAFKSIYGQIDDYAMLKTRPKGFPKDFKDMELLKHKSFTTTMHVSDDNILSGQLVENLIPAIKAILPFNQYLRKALS